MSKKEKYIAIEMDSREKEFKVILIIGQLCFFFFLICFYKHRSKRVLFIPFCVNEWMFLYITLLISLC